MSYFPIGTSLCVDSNWVIKRLTLSLIYISRVDPLTQANPFSFVNTFYHFNFCDNSFSLPQLIFFINSLWIDLGLPRIYYLRQPTLGFATFKSYQSHTHTHIYIYIFTFIYHPKNNEKELKKLEIKHKRNKNRFVELISVQLTWRWSNLDSIQVLSI